MHRRTLLAALCLAPMPALGQPASAEAFLRDIYAPYLTGSNKGQDYWQLERFFTPDLIRLIDAEAQDAKRRNEPPRLDGDPFVDAQDWDVRNFTLTVTADGATATGVATFDSYGRAVRIVFDMILTPAGWRIRDITAPSGSLRSLYK